MGNENKPTITKGKIVPKGWGKELIIDNNELYCAKLLIFNKGCKGSLHFHLNKTETFYVQKGSFNFSYNNTVNGEICETILVEGYIVKLLPGQTHQLEALVDSIIFETSTHHEDNDSYRVGPGTNQK